MRVILINLFTPFTGSIYTSGLVHLEPLGLEYIGAAAMEAGHDVRIISPYKNENLEVFAERIITESPDVIGIGPATYNFNQAKTLSRIIKVRQRKTFIVFGGYHISAVPEEVADPVIDLAIIGEGEYTFVEVLERLKKGLDYEDVGGISFLKNDRIIVNPRRERIHDLDKLPYPLRNKNEMTAYRCRGIYNPPAGQQSSVAQVAYSRGCPFRCSYCSSHNMWGNSVAYRDAGMVADEIQYLMDNFGTNLIFFSDLTFNLNRRKVIELCETIIRRNIKISWFCGCRPEGMDDALIGMMKEAGCTRIHYGIESIDEYSLRKIHRKKTFSFLEGALECTSRAGIITRGYLMIGYPWETAEQYETIPLILNKLSIDELRLSYFTPFPGTSSYNEFKEIIETNNWECYTTDRPIIRLKDLEEEDLLKIRDKIFIEFYNNQDYIKRVIAKIAAFPELHDSFLEFFEEMELKECLDTLRKLFIDYKWKMHYKP